MLALVLWVLCAGVVAPSAAHAYDEQTYAYDVALNSAVPVARSVGAASTIFFLTDAADVEQVSASLDYSYATNAATRPVIGGMEDLGSGSLRAGEATVASRLPGDAGNRLGNWLNNRDASVDSAGNLLYQDTRRFITLERDFLRSNGWTYDPPSNLWMPPG